MGGNLAHDFAIYPMVEEDEATGRVAAVFSQVRERMPLVPSLFNAGGMPAVSLRRLAAGGVGAGRSALPGGCGGSGRVGPRCRGAPAAVSIA